MSIPRLRLPLAWTAVACLLLWVLGVSGATGWGLSVNWTFLLVGVALLGVRRVT